MKPVVLDTGPLVAYFDKNDPGHAPVKHWFAEQSSGCALFTCEAVITEVTHMLDFSVPLQAVFLEWVAQAVRIQTIQPNDYLQIAQWMRKYSNVPMDFADACVLYHYQQLENAQILTLDQRGFGVFRLPDTPKNLPRVIAL